MEFPSEVVSGEGACLSGSSWPAGRPWVGASKVGCILLAFKASDISPPPERRGKPEGSAEGVLLRGSSPVSRNQFAPFPQGQAPASAAHST